MKNAPSWIEFPLVTGIMVFDRPQQVAAARASVTCFLQQSWPHKELVVYNTTSHRLLRWFHRSRGLEIRLKGRQHTQMLAQCLENSNGEWCVHWLPDCWYAPDYIALHMQHRDKESLVLLKHAQAFALKNKSYAIMSDFDTNWSFYRHCPVNLESKVPIADQFAHVKHLDNPANLVVKFASELI